MATRKRRAEMANSAENGVSDIDLTKAPVPLDAEEHLLQIPDSRRALISLIGKGFERALLWKLDWVNYMYASLFSVPSSFPGLVTHTTTEK